MATQPGEPQKNVLSVQPPTPLKPIPSNPVPGSIPRKGQLKQEFIDALKVLGISERTIKLYCNAVALFQKFLHRDPRTATINEIRAFFFT